MVCPSRRWRSLASEAAMRKGSQIRTRKRAAVKSKGPGKARNTALDHHPLMRYVNLHLEWLRTTGYSEATVSTRRNALARFVGWCDERSIVDPREVTRPMIERYQHYLFYFRKADGNSMTIGSQHGFLAALKTLFKWLTRENHIAYNPASEIILPRKGRQLPRHVLTVAEVEAILSEAVPDSAQGLRDRAMLETLYSTGVRRMELPGLMLYDVDLARRVLFVREGKGKRDRVIPIGERAAAWVRKYLAEARPLLLMTLHEALFVTDYGEPVTPAFVATRVRRYKQFAGITKPGETHMFRHACATHMLEGGADIRFIQAMLGHANLATTQIYTHVSIDKLREIHAATHPARLVRLVEAGAPTAGDPVAAAALLAELDAEAEDEDGGEEEGER
jgi:integrase/recombinase XerD